MKKLWVLILLLAILLPACTNNPTPTPTLTLTLTPTTLPPTATADSYPAPPPPPPATATATSESYPQPLPTATADSYPQPVATATSAPYPPREETETKVGTAVPRYTFQIIDSYDHDPNSYTQGLIYEDGIFYEGSGQYGESTLRKVDPASGEILQIIDLPEQYFGEGITVFGDKIIQLTWQEQTGFVYDKDSFELLNEFSYPTQGWGITHDGQKLIMSDGSATLYFWDPETLTEIGRIDVSDANGPITRLNELEYIEGEIWANVWQTNLIARIDPDSGQVLGWIDLTGLLNTAVVTQQVDVLNGIAYDDDTDRIFVTGKWWPQLYEIELVPME
jgi:glutamine cyclotransferase